MKQEHNELLLKDLCARLPYGVKVQIKEVSDYTNEYLSPKIKTLCYLLLGKLCAVIKGYRKDDIKPYLFPLSSMTEEQQLFCCTNLNYMPYYQRVDWFNKHHIDYRGLIQLGIAIDATGKNIY